MAALFSKWICRFGVPAIISSDTGAQFTSNIWDSLCLLLQIRHQPTTAYHPQAVWRIWDVYPKSRILIFIHPGSRIPDLGSRIPDLGSRIPDLGSRIPDPKTATKEKGEKKFDVIPFYVATNFTKLYIILVLKW